VVWGEDAGLKPAATTYVARYNCRGAPFTAFRAGSCGRPRAGTRPAPTSGFMAYFLGVDGGGTQTTAWLADEGGRILARSRAGPSNPLKVGSRAAQQGILQVVTRALRRARLKAVTFDAVCVGLGGVDRPRIHRPLLTWLRKAVPARFHLLASDAAIALHAAVGHSAGVLVISGTGSIACARDESGKMLRAGGWGIPFDDAGSGYDLGRKAVAAALRDFDGRGPHTQLTKRVSRALGLRRITEVVAQDLPQRQVAALFPVVMEAARRRDAVARLLCEEAGRDLAELALALLRRLGWQRRAVSVSCAGGVLRASAGIRRSFARHVARSAPRARVALCGREPVEGALALAREAAARGKIPPGYGPRE
jgi:glucosamine kinase